MDTARRLFTFVSAVGICGLAGWGLYCLTGCQYAGLALLPSAHMVGKAAGFYVART
jgi:hypothetical protein